MSETIYTFGYESLSFETFVRRLNECGVTSVLDVRELPLSRKPGFSKNAMSARLRDADIDYQHLPAMGCPRPIRNQYKADGDWKAYTAAFMEYLGSRDADVVEIATRLRHGVHCLICFEADFRLCHRTYVARAISAKTAMPVVHITSRTTIADPATRQAAA